MSSKVKSIIVLFAIVIAVALAYLAGSLNSSRPVEASSNTELAIAKLDKLSIQIAALEKQVADVAACACSGPVVYTNTITVPELVYVSPIITQTRILTETRYVTETRIISKTVAQEEVVDVREETRTVTSTPSVERRETRTTPTPTQTVERVTVTVTPTPKAVDEASTNTPEPTSTPKAEHPTPTPDATKESKQKCNQGVGNGPEGCSPGKSDDTVNPNHPHGPNDEGPDSVPGNPGRKQEAQDKKNNK